MCIVHQYYQKPCSKMWFEIQYCYIHSMDLLVKFALLQMARAHLVEKCTLWVSIVTFKAYLSIRKLCTCICNATSFEELTFLDHGLWNQPWAQDPMSQIWISSGLRPSHWSSVTFLSSTLWQTTNRRLSPLPHTLEHCEYHFKYHFFSNAKSTMLMFMLMQFKYLVLYRWTKYGNESWP